MPHADVNGQRDLTRPEPVNHAIADFIRDMT